MSVEDEYKTRVSVTRFMFIDKVMDSLSIIIAGAPC